MPLPAQPPAAPATWKTWGLDEWNERLFAYCFDATLTTAPQTRIPALPDDLRRVTGDDAATRQEAEDAFVRAVWVPRSMLESRLSLDFWSVPKPPVTSTPRRAPKAFAYLYLSCYAAAGGDDAAAVVTQGQYRDRLNALMGGWKRGYDVQMALKGLSGLWRTFAAWLNGHAPELCLRGIILPIPTYKLIGYSLKLALPTRGDRLVLADALKPLRGFSPPPIEGVKRCVEGISYKFSDGFAKRYYAFVWAWKGGSGELRDLAFWEAVLDAVRLDPKGPEPRVPLRVVLDPNRERGETRLLVFTNHGAPVPPGWRVEQQAHLPGRFDALVSPLERGPHDSARALLGCLGGKMPWPKAYASPYAALVADGVLVFCRESDDLEALQVSLPPRGERARLLVSSARAPAIAAITKAPPNESPYPGWVWVDVADIAVFHRELPHSLKAVRVLQPTWAPPALRLRGGARTSSGAYVGRAGALPLVVAPLASIAASAVARVVAEPVGATTGDDVPLAPTNEARVFAFAASVAPTGEYRIAGYDAVGTRVAHVAVRFEDGDDATRYKSPPTLGGFFVETADDGGEADDRDAPWMVPVSTALPWSGAAPTLLAKTAPVSGAMPKPVVSAGAVSAATFVEVLAARSSQRAGMAEAEVVALAQQHLGAWFGGGSGAASGTGGPNGWAVLRSWEEAGAYDVLQRRNARARLYLARPVALAWHGHEARAWALVDGLVTAATAARVEGAAAKAGVAIERPEPLVAWSPPRLRLGPAPLEVFAALAGALELPFREAPRLAWVPVGQAGGVQGFADLPPHDVWDWAKSRFFPVPPTVAPPHPGTIRLERYLPANGSPAFRVRTSKGVREFETFTRAVLEARVARGEACFALAEGGLVPIGRPRPQLPVPLARALVARTGQAPVALSKGDPVGYVYPCGNALGDEVIACLEGGGVLVDAPAAPDGAPILSPALTWILAGTAQRSSAGARVYVAGLSGAASAVRGGVPLHLWQRLRTRAGA